jgi:GNAT superfamily N-acetyltransferase
MIKLRLATPGDFDAVLPRSRALNAHEGIEVAAPVFEAALRRLLAEREIGGCWVVERDGAPIGYAIVTFGFDLEFGGRDSYLTELWIDPEARGRGAGTAVLGLLWRAARARGPRAAPAGPAREPGHAALRAQRVHGVAAPGHDAAAGAVGRAAGQGAPNARAGGAIPGRRSARPGA